MLKCVLTELFRSVTALSLLCGCASLDNSGKDFEEWFYGPAGMPASMHDQHAGKRRSYGTGGACVILEEPPHIYGYFRPPELLLQPACGLAYPERLPLRSLTRRAETG